MASVEFLGVCKSFTAGAAAVSDLTLQVADRELLVMVGPSGCGKSTVLRLLAGLEAPSQGEIRIGDRVVNKLTPQERNVAMVFQDYALYPFLSVRKNIEFPLKMRGLGAGEMQEQVERIAALLSLGSLLDRLPKQLSGGQRQRVAMARALVREPAVSLLDEPLSNLDAKLRVQVRAEIAELQQRTGTTMLYVTHDQVEAMTLGHRVAVLHQGKLQQVATPRELYERPANVFVAGFIGNPPMNLLSTTTCVVDGALAVRIGGSEIRLISNTAGLSIGSAVTVGVRPEALRLQAASGDARIEAQVGYVEYLGHETLVHADSIKYSGAEAIRWIARLSGMHSLEVGTPLTLAVQATDIHIFGKGGEHLDGFKT